MAQTITLQFKIPEDLPLLELPRGLNVRLHELLNRLKRDGKLSRKERSEAEAIVEVAEIFSLIKIRLHQAIIALDDR